MNNNRCKALSVGGVILLKTMLTVLQLLAAAGLIATVLFQSGKRSGLSVAISGAADTFMSKNKAKTWDARLAKATTWIAIGFILLTLSLSLV